MENEIKPLSPHDIMDNIEKIIPTFVIEAVNNLLIKKFRGGEVTIKQLEIMEEIKRLSDITSTEVYLNKWMDFEEVYNKNGWIVNYDKPGYDENYDAFFTFKPITRK